MTSGRTARRHAAAAWPVDTCKQHRGGEAACRCERDVARRRWQAALDAGFDRPLAGDGAHPNLRSGRAIRYGQAALFIDALRQAIGGTALRDGPRRDTRDNAGRSLQAVFDRRAAPG